MKIWTVILLIISVGSIVFADVIEFEPHDEEEEPYLINGGTHDFDKMVSDFGAAFTENHFRFADMNANWVYKFEFGAPAEVTVTMDLGAEFKVSIATSRADEEPEYVVALEEENQTHALQNKGEKIIEFSDYFENPGNTIWIKFEDSRPQDGWGPYLDSFSLEYTLGFSVDPTLKIATTWSKIKIES